MEAVFGYQTTHSKKKVSNNDVGVFENVARNMVQHFWLLSHILVTKLVHMQPYITV